MFLIKDIRVGILHVVVSQRGNITKFLDELTKKTFNVKICNRQHDSHESSKILGLHI